MSLNTVLLNEKGNNSKALEVAEKFIKKNKLKQKDSLHLRLLIEETMEMLRLSGNTGETTLKMDGNASDCRIHLSMNSKKDAETRRSLRDTAMYEGVTGKIRLLLNTGYEELDSRSEVTESIGVRKASADDLKEMGLGSSEEAFVWSIEAYNMSLIDRSFENDEDLWLEISHSIIANLAEDVRIFVFRDRTELAIQVSFSKSSKNIEDKYNIDPELAALYKIPVSKTRFQIKLVQMLYGKLVNKQASTSEYTVLSHSIPCTSAEGKVTVLEYRPAGEEFNKPSASVLFLHGGAYLFPALPYHYRLATAVATRACCRVFLVIHDLGPKNRPPIQNRQASEIYRYLLENSKKYGIDKECFAVMGDSSGATMAAAVCLLARDSDIQSPAGQLLIYPSLDNRGNTKSMEKYTDVPVINSDAIRIYRKMLHNDDTEESKKYYISPAEADSLDSLPPAYIETAEFDALHDDGIEYADLLRKAGCEVILNETKGTVHSYDMAKDSAVLAAAMDKRIEFLNQILKKS